MTTRQALACIVAFVLMGGIAMMRFRTSVEILPETGVVQAITGEAAFEALLRSAAPTAVEIRGGTGGGGGGGSGGDGASYRYSYTYNGTFRAPGTGPPAIRKALAELLERELQALGVNVTGNGGTTGTGTQVIRLGYETETHGGQVLTLITPLDDDVRYSIVANVFETTTRRR